MDAQTLREVMGGDLPDGGYMRLIDGFNTAMREAGVTTVKRAAMWCAQLGHESVGLLYMREIASGAEYEGRGDLGNVYRGDGVKFAGRGPIQLTGRSNYRAFTRWAQSRGLTDIDFEAHPERLEEPHWGFLAATYYWTAARPQLNALADAGDLEGATRAINGGLNGLADRHARYNRALTFGARLLPDGGKPPVEKVLDYPRDQVRQDTFYNCGPASSQTVIRSKTGKLITESDLGAQLGTDTGGTDWIGLIAPVLNKYMPGAGYKVREMPNDPPSSTQKQQLWDDVVGSINGGHGVVANIVAPPSNYPRAVAPSTISPAYGGGTVYHYIAVMGYGEDGGGRRYWVADSGFSPYGYWISHEQLASLIPPKGYAYAAPVKAAQHEEAGDMLTTKFFTDWISGFFGPQFQALQEIWTQLRGPGGKGWAQLGQNAQGQNLTPVDALAAIRVQLAQVQADVNELKGGKR